MNYLSFDERLEGCWAGGVWHQFADHGELWRFRHPHRHKFPHQIVVFGDQHLFVAVVVTHQESSVVGDIRDQDTVNRSLSTGVRLVTVEHIRHRLKKNSVSSSLTTRSVHFNSILLASVEKVRFASVVFKRVLVPIFPARYPSTYLWSSGGMIEGLWSPCALSAQKALQTS